jgi:hypothetical protein
VQAASGIINGIGAGGRGFPVSLQWKGEGIPIPGVFLQEWQAKDLWLTWRVRVANTRLKVAVFSAVCGLLARVARKGLRE